MGFLFEHRTLCHSSLSCRGQSCQSLLFVIGLANGQVFSPGRGIGGGKEPPGRGEGRRTLETQGERQGLDSLLNLSPPPLGEQTKLHGKQQQQLVSYGAFWAGIGAVGLSGQLARLVQEHGPLQSSRLLCSTLPRFSPAGKHIAGWARLCREGPGQAGGCYRCSVQTARNPLRT